MKYLIAVFLLCLSLAIQAQPERIGAGLAFSSGVDYNASETGNPGLYARAYISLLNNLSVVPALTAFYPKVRDNQYASIRNFMYHADLDFQYMLVEEGDLQFSAFGGMNLSGIISNFEEEVPSTGLSIEDKSEIKPGFNLGLNVNMFVDHKFDGILSAKYIAGPWSQFVVSVGLAYNISGKRLRGW